MFEESAIEAPGPLLDFDESTFKSYIVRALLVSEALSWRLRLPEAKSVRAGKSQRGY